MTETEITELRNCFLKMLETGMELDIAIHPALVCEVWRMAEILHIDTELIPTERRLFLGERLPEAVHCPYCNGLCDAEFVDIGVGLEQVAPYQCRDCTAVQISPYADLKDYTQEEIKIGWMKGI